MQVIYFSPERNVGMGAADRFSESVYQLRKLIKQKMVRPICAAISAVVDSDVHHSLCSFTYKHVPHGLKWTKYIIIKQ